MKNNYLKLLFNTLLITILIISCENLLDENDIDSFSKYDVEYIYQTNNKEYDKMSVKYYNLNSLNEQDIINRINTIKSNKNRKGGIVVNNDEYTITIKQYNLIANLYFFKDNKHFFYNYYDLSVNNSNFSIEKYGITLQSNKEEYYTFEIQTFIIFKMLDEEYNTIFVKVPLNIKGKFNLQNNYLDYEMDL